MKKQTENTEILPGGDWMSSKWRPAMGWIYMAICVCDFIIFPIAWTLIQAHFKGDINDQWDPITLQGAGLIHMAFGAILGIAAWSRGQEKITAMNQGYDSSDQPSHRHYRDQDSRDYRPRGNGPPKVSVYPRRPIDDD